MQVLLHALPTVVLIISILQGRPSTKFIGVLALMMAAGKGTIISVVLTLVADMLKMIVAPGM